MLCLEHIKIVCRIRLNTRISGNETNATYGHVTDSNNDNRLYRNTTVNRIKADRLQQDGEKTIRNDYCQIQGKGHRTLLEIQSCRSDSTSECQTPRNDYKRCGIS